jgi:tetratricopeptide (TPR) repeat protein
LTLQDDGLLPTLKATAEAKRAASEAIRLDDMLAEPRISLGHAYFHEFNWPAAQREFKYALDLNPNYATAHFYYANYLVVTEQFEDALAGARRAQALDPVSLPAGSNTAMALYYGRQYDQSIQQSLLVLETDPKFARSYEDLGRSYWETGMWREAIKSFKRAVTYSGRGSGFIASLAHAYASAGKSEEARNLLKELTALAQKQYVSPYAFALVYVGMGNKDQAVAWLDKAYQERASALPFVKVNPRLASLHADPRLHNLLRRLGLES